MLLYTARYQDPCVAFALALDSRPKTDNQGNPLYHRVLWIGSGSFPTLIVVSDFKCRVGSWLSLQLAKR